ncbi:PREDICTED: THO complex subunit 5B [Tarenaya hassleriana]|uniref:THO complex subunit 5B n=1 Tax=Tarenaya hassleriana TaxID=28532 RepID=UPI00053C9453|nr:PREDICTED: THO complex subunit 5B [Tarenaya hassleriana]
MEGGEFEEGVVTEEEAPSSETVVSPAKAEKSPYVLLRESKSSAGEIVAKMLSIKREGKPKSEIRELLTNMFLNFVNLRQANRLIMMEEERVKAETERANAPVDFTTLQLHNLTYEKSHYVKAIKGRRDFESKYPDIDLVPEEEFFRDAPDSIKCPTLSNDSSHDMMLKRLNFELHQRKDLCKLRARLEQQKKSLLETISDRKKFLSSLPSHLKSLKKASLPVQNQFGLQDTKKMKHHHHLAELLPPPLYVIYSQLVAQKEAFEESIDLEIVGSLKDTQSYVRQQANKDPGMSNSTESTWLDDDDDDDDGQRRRKRPKKLSGNQGSDQAGLYQVHPLEILLHIYDDEIPDPKSRKLVVLKFEYLLNLNVICVSTEGSRDGSESDDILSNLFPDDAGLEPPHQSAKLILGDGRAFDESRASRPYKWAQHLAGIDILPEMSPFLAGRDGESSGDGPKNDDTMTHLSLYRQQHRVQTLLQRLRTRRKAQLALV